MDPMLSINIFTECIRYARFCPRHWRDTVNEQNRHKVLPSEFTFYRGKHTINILANKIQILDGDNTMKKNKAKKGFRCEDEGRRYFT